jgi:hypothetical protein
MRPYPGPGGGRIGSSGSEQGFVAGMPVFRLSHCQTIVTIYKSFIGLREEASACPGGRLSADQLIASSLHRTLRKRSDVLNPLKIAGETRQHSPITAVRLQTRHP